MARSKKTSTQRLRPRSGRVLRTNAELAAWLFGLDRRRKLERLAHYERQTQVILGVPNDPRRRIAERLARLIPVAQGNLEREHPADWQMAEIERLGLAANTLVLGPPATHGGKFHPRRQKGELWRAIVEILRAEPPPLSWSRVMRAVVKRLPAAHLSVDPWRLTYGDGEEINQDSFKVLLSKVRKSLRQLTK
jgi:hypothetical protein